jgi:hypothetical protein
MLTTIIHYTEITGYIMIGFGAGGLLTAFYTSIKLAQHGISANAPSLKMPTRGPVC